MGLSVNVVQIIKRCTGAIYDFMLGFHNWFGKGAVDPLRITITEYYSQSTENFDTVTCGFVTNISFRFPAVHQKTLDFGAIYHHIKTRDRLFN